MARLYAAEKGKLGANSGFIFPFVVTISSADPDDPNNAYTLPAGFLKCDGTVYDADDFPALAGITGAGTQCRFRGDKTLADDKFRVPDLGAKVIRASQSDVGTVNDSTVETSSGAIVKRAGVAVTIDNNVGDTIEIGYTGNLRIPARNVDVNGNPGWTIPRRTDGEVVLSNQLQPHAHYSTTMRLRHADNAAFPGFVYANSYVSKFGTMLCGSGKDFDMSLQNPIIVGGRNVDIQSETGGNDDNTEHAHQIIYSPGINHTATATGFLHDYQINILQTDFPPDGLTSTAPLRDSGAYKFDDVVSPFILVQYIIKF
jgi:hypothetical protein